MKLTMLVSFPLILTLGSAQDAPPPPPEGGTGSPVPPSPTESPIPPAPAPEDPGATTLEAEYPSYHRLEVSYERPINIAKFIAGDGVYVKSVVYYGDGVQRGVFNHGLDTIGFEEGGIFSTGDIKDVVNGEDGTGLDEPGYQPLTDLIDKPTRDASVLRIVFKCPSRKKKVSLNYVFGSNEYPTSGVKDNEDVMAIYLNGKKPSNNIALVGGQYVSTDTLFEGDNFIDNESLDYDVEMDGFTVPLKTKVRTGRSTWNEVRIVLADGGYDPDQHTNSYLFIRKGGLRCSS
jgi:hypothetical protein